MSKKDLTFTEDKRSIKRENAWRDKNVKMPKDQTGADYADRTIFARRAAEFQAMHNPMSMTSFEQECVNQEKNSRQDARRNYIRGIQGRDGGNKCDDYESKFEDGPETN
jgi:hypothetical protein